MEYGLWPTVVGSTYAVGAVLILVLMEYGLWPDEEDYASESDSMS